MKKFMYFVLMAVAVVTTLYACSGGNQPDYEGIREVMSKNSDEISSDDIDFIIDQVEVMSDIMSDKTPEQRKDWMESLDKEDQETVFALGMVASMMPNHNKKLSPEQKERLERIIEKNRKLEKEMNEKENK